MQPTNIDSGKMYAPDTSVLLHSPQSLFSFDENTVIITQRTIDELIEYRSQPGEIGANAREALRILAELASHGTLSAGVPLKNGGTLIAMPNYDPARDPFIHNKGTLVTLDDAVYVRCNNMGMKVERYRTDSVVPREGGYDGRCIVYVPSSAMREFAFTKHLALRDDFLFLSVSGKVMEKYKPTINEFAVLTDSSNPQSTMLARWDGEQFVSLLYQPENQTVFGVTPRNVGQRFALEALMAPASVAPLVILKGAAGTAKTFLAMAAALECVTNPREEDEVHMRRILVTRPNTKFDDDIGFLKGGEAEKIGPLIRPVLDNLENLMARNERSGKSRKDGKDTGNTYDYFFDKGIITAQAMAYMRGRSICNNFIVIDEAQNATPNQILGLITRPGEGTKIVILGDPDQIDNMYLDRTNNGLVYASERMKGSPLCWQVSFTEEECTRSPLASEAINRMSGKTACVR